jgi:hypothetical protein
MRRNAILSSHKDIEFLQLLPIALLHLPGIIILFLPITRAFPEHRIHVKCGEVIPLVAEEEERIRWPSFI